MVAVNVQVGDVTEMMQAATLVHCANLVAPHGLLDAVGVGGRELRQGPGGAIAAGRRAALQQRDHRLQRARLLDQAQHENMNAFQIWATKRPC